MEMGGLIYIGVDPGEVTGICVYVDQQWQGWEIPAESVSERLHATVERYGVKNIRIGCEQYVQRRNSRLTEQPQAQRITGVVQGLGCFTRLIAPSTAKAMCTDHRLRQLGWYSKTPDGHINDGSRVLFALIAITSPQLVNSLLPLG
jgi:hypothetical protein